MVLHVSLYKDRRRRRLLGIFEIECIIRGKNAVNGIDEVDRLAHCQTTDVDSKSAGRWLLNITFKGNNRRATIFWYLNKQNTGLKD